MPMGPSELDMKIDRKHLSRERKSERERQPSSPEEGGRGRKSSFSVATPCRLHCRSVEILANMMARLGRGFMLSVPLVRFVFFFFLSFHIFFLCGRHKMSS